jgi:hypothetical protein
MAGLGELTIPEATAFGIWSRGQISSYYDRVLDAVSRLEQDIVANVPRTTEGDALRTEFRAFKGDFLRSWSLYHDSWPAGDNATPIAIARDSASRYNAFEATYRSITGRAPRAGALAPVVVVEGPAPTVGGLPVWAWAGIGIVGLGLVGWITMSVSRTAARFSPAGLFANPRRRRVRRRR